MSRKNAPERIGDLQALLPEGWQHHGIISGRSGMEKYLSPLINEYRTRNHRISKETRHNDPQK
jgi:hypothetical protein